MIGQCRKCGCKLEKGRCWGCTMGIPMASKKAIKVKMSKNTEFEMNSKKVAQDSMYR